MAKNSKQQREIANRRRKVADYLNRGIENDEKIIELLKAEHGIKVSKRTIGYDKRAVWDRWIEEQAQSIEEKQSRIEAKYLAIYQQATEAWLKSLQDEITTIEESAVGTSGKGSERAKVQTKKRGQSGNPALLAQAQAALKAIRELRGTDAAQRIEHSGEMSIEYVNNWREQN
jgi:hypothetical protein